MDEDLKQNLQEKSTWMRALYMVLFAVIFGLLEIVITAVVLFQFISALITGGTNEKLRDFGQNLSTYLYQIMLFLTFNSDDRPYPFAEWPEGTPAAGKPTPKKRAAKKATPKAVAKKKEPEEKDSEEKSSAAEDETA